MKQTPLHAQHIALGAKMVDFSGWDMPLQYTSIVKEHKATRAAGGLFDVSHMGQARLSGSGATAMVDRLMTNDPKRLANGKAMYTLMCNERGGVVDDLIVYRISDEEYLIVLNAANVEKDLAWIRQHKNESTTVSDESAQTALIAVQGPKAMDLLERLYPGALGKLAPFATTSTTLGGISAFVARTGYTGEDGCEIALPGEAASAVWQSLVEAGAESGIVPVGLGARDTLRLEAKLCLYGNDLSDDISPIEAGLGWAVKLDDRQFIGSEVLRQQKADGPARKLVGFRMVDKGIPRHGYGVATPQGTPIGEVTSGGKGITVDAAIGLALIDAPHAQIGTQIAIDCRGKTAHAEIVKGKFYTRS